METFAPKVLDGIIARLVKELHPERIVLFGSHARGESREESDLDLLVVVPDPPARAEAWALARRIAPGLPLQLIFMSPREWEETRDVVGGVAYPASREGRVLYAA